MLIPSLNEERNISDVIQLLKQLGYDNILVIDGKSSDRTVETAKDLGANVIIQNGNGKGAALREAFEHADSDFVVIMDADGSMNPKEIPLLIEGLSSGADVVKGSRFLHSGHSYDMTLIRRIGNQLFILLVNWFWSADYTDLCYGFGAFRKDAIRKLSPHLKSTNFEIETEVFIKAKKLGLKVAETPSVELRRGHGKSNLHSLRDGLSILRTILKELVNDPSNLHGGKSQIGRSSLDFINFPKRQKSLEDQSSSN